LRFVWARNKLPTSYFLLLRFTLGGGARTTDRANAPPKGRPISLAVRKQRALASPSARLPRRLTLAGAGVGPAPTGSLLARCPCRSPRRPRRANAAHAAGRRQCTETPSTAEGRAARSLACRLGARLPAMHLLPYSCVLRPRQPSRRRGLVCVFYGQPAARGLIFLAQL
jgi:hypothetical protein